MAAKLPRNPASEIEARLVEDEYTEALLLIMLTKHGIGAERAIITRIYECDSDGDVEGARVWREVAARFSKGVGNLN